MTSIIRPLQWSTLIIRVVATTGLYAASSQMQKTLVKKCIENDRSSNNQCRPDIGIFVVGDSHDEIRDHIADAQSSGSPSIVTRRAKAHSRAWLARLKRQGVVCQGSGDCDEYPMAIHKEGGEFGQTSLRSVNASQNRSIGGMVRAFHSRCKVEVGKKYKVVAIQGVPLSGGVCEK